MRRMDAALDLHGGRGADSRARRASTRCCPRCSAWYLRDGDAARPSYLDARRALHAAHARARAARGRRCASARAGETWPRACSRSTTRRRCSPGCSQAVIDGALVRNYDYHPDRIEGTVFASAIMRPVLGMSDCLWGLLDGVNDAGLAVALAFGGRTRAAPGSGSRSSCATCSRPATRSSRPSTTLARLPVHAPYNLTLADAHGDAATVYRRARPRRARRPARGRDQPPGAGRLARARARDPQRRAPRRAAATRPPRTPSSSRRCTRPSSRAASARSTPPSTGPGSRAVTYRWPRRELGPVAGRLYARHAGPSDSRSVQTATSALVLGDLVAQEDLGLTLLSGGAGALDREVAGAHCIDVEEPTRFLERRWIMLTAGMRLKGSVAAQRALVRGARRGRDQRARDRRRPRLQARPARAAGGGPRARVPGARGAAGHRRSATSSASSTARCSPATCTPTSA